MPFIHKDLAAGRWFTLTYAEQLGNLGSEVERTIRAIEAGDPKGKQRAWARALELLDLTLNDPRRETSRKNSGASRKSSATSSKGKMPPAPRSNRSGGIFRSGD